jgi:multiple sugar transport system substrate-binding protein
MTDLRGITWQHTRGYLPMVATAQRFSELHPDVQIRWEVRSLQAFADQSIAQLAEKFDLLVIDHPFCGRAARGDVLLPLDELLEQSFLDGQKNNQVGASYDSYEYDGHLWALPVDTATPVSGTRIDLMETHNVQQPQTWADVLELARTGHVALPAIAIDSLMNFYMLCGALGSKPFQQPDVVSSTGIGAQALEMLRELVSLCDRSCLTRNPIATWELMSSTDDVLYCPFAYGYSNYARRGYARSKIDFGGLVTMDEGTPLRSVLGGAGLSISLSTRHHDIAAQYAAFVASPEVQSGIYFEAGGQPGHRTAWIDTEVNRRSEEFFGKTLRTLDEAYVRPRFDGYLHFQEAAGLIVHRYLSHGGDSGAVMERLNALLRSSQSGDGEAKL